MKVLFLAAYIYEEKIKEFTKNKTGYGMMVKDIAKSVSDAVEIYLLTNVITRDSKLSKINVIGHRPIDIIKVQNFKSIFHSIKSLFVSDESFSMRLRYVYYTLDSYYIDKVIEELHPDIIHIHGLSFRTSDFIKIANKYNIPHIVTLHALIGLDDSVGATKYDILYEKKFFNEIMINNTIVTVISSGMKDRILKEFNSKLHNKITIINNGINIPHEYVNDTKIKEKYRIPYNGRIMVCIGNISDRKNQIQIVHAYNLLPKVIKDTLYIFFLGNDAINGKLERLIYKYKLNEKLIPCGFVRRSQLKSFLEIADYNIVASKDEAFGLSIIEAFSYGIPTVAFSNLDAIDDLYRDDAMVLVKDRKTNSLAHSIEEIYNKNWDRHLIKRYSLNFSMENMGIKYTTLYNKVCQKEMRKNKI